MNSTVIKSCELGVNCWSAHRFCGGRCQRVMNCNYPEKATCKAVDSEISYLNNYYSTEIERLDKQYTASMTRLKAKHKTIAEHLKNK